MPTNQDAVHLKNFAMSIPEAHEVSGGYALLTHGTRYSIILRNRSTRRCDVVVKIDGLEVGKWRVNAHSFIQVERPVSDSGIFTFIDLETPEARAAGLVRNEELGLVTAEFRPERIQTVMFNPGSRSPYRAGGTGLSGRSDQTFSETAALEFDPNEAVTLHLRLASKIPTVRPLAPRETPVPPPLH